MGDERRPHPHLDPRRYYDEYGHDEWDRLEATLGGVLEFRGTVAELERFLPPPPSDGSPVPSVVDVGGGAGRYTVWLAARGYDVTLVDSSARQCEIAREKVHEHEVDGCASVHRGDLRALPVASEAADAVLCTGGPLSHVVDDAERRRALAELERVARPGAPVFVSVMGRLAVVQNLLEDPAYYPVLAEILDSGTYSRELAADYFQEPTFVECHFFRAAELEAALTDAGLTVERLVGLESVGANVGERIPREERTDAAVELAERALAPLRTDPAVVDWANHILAVGRA
ncbi:class I SAM-dependent methyltransferase [Natronobiforma cellulositropha]|uniref:class I SAM-dependent methyltransferase n=1 Tax=Natronobiforma cellulositropha TaxID=1679076 RepID=UPI0021D6078B|nr:class I SAM-dependent methyltransferase [Natronobiforma cellulositropha]